MLRGLCLPTLFALGLLGLPALSSANSGLRADLKVVGPATAADAIRLQLEVQSPEPIERATVRFSSPKGFLVTPGAGWSRPKSMLAGQKYSAYAKVTPQQLGKDVLAVTWEGVRNGTQVSIHREILLEARGGQISARFLNKDDLWVVPAGEGQPAPNFFGKNWKPPLPAPLDQEPTGGGGLNTAGIDCTVSGTFWVRNSENQDFSVAGCAVDAYDDDGFLGDQYLGTTITDFNGNWTFSFDNDTDFEIGQSGTADFFVRYRPANSVTEVQVRPFGIWTTDSALSDRGATNFSDIPDGTHSFGLRVWSGSIFRFIALDAMTRAWAHVTYDYGYSGMPWIPFRNDFLLVGEPGWDWFGALFSGGQSFVYAGWSGFGAYRDTVATFYGALYQFAVTGSAIQFDMMNLPEATAHVSAQQAFGMGLSAAIGAGTFGYPDTLKLFKPGRGLETINIEENHDGFSSANGNTDDFSGTSGRTSGHTQLAAIAGFFLDLMDSRQDAHDYMNLSPSQVHGVMSTYRPGGLYTATAQQFFDGFTLQNRPHRPRISGLMMTHGMTQSRDDFSPVGLISSSISSNWTRNGGAAAAMEVRNFGSQSITIPAFWALLTGPAGQQSNPTQLGVTGPVTLAPGAGYFFNPSVRHILPEHRVTGTHRVLFAQTSPGNQFRAMWEANPGVAWEYYPSVVADTTGPNFLNVQDEGNATYSNNWMRITAQSDDFNGGIEGYWVAIGSFSGDTSIRGWEFFPRLNQTSFDIALTFPPQGVDDVLVATVYSRNTDGILSAPVATDGIRILDATAPVITWLDDGVTSATTTQVSITATASEPETSVDAWWYRIYDQFGSEVRGWTNTELTGGTLNFTATGLNLVNNRVYFVEVAAMNRDGIFGYRTSDGVRTARPVRVAFNVQLPDVGERSKLVEIYVKNPGVGTGGYVQYATALLDSGGGTSFETTYYGERGIILRTDRHLWRLRDIKINSDLTFQVAGTWTLINGDVDGDNSITIFDYIELSQAFDTSRGEAGFRENADLDEDGTITVFDYIILSNNFGLDGDY